MDRERKEHLMLKNPVRSKGESRFLSWPSRALSVGHNMSDPGKISARCPSPDGTDMFHRDCSKWIVGEKNTYVEEHSSEPVRKSISLFALTGPVCYTQYE